MVAPITVDRCPLPYGAVCLKQAFLNKRDWAMLHSHEFHAFPVARDPALPGTWYRLALLKQAGCSPPSCVVPIETKPKFPNCGCARHCMMSCVYEEGCTCSDLAGHFLLCENREVEVP